MGDKEIRVLGITVSRPDYYTPWGERLPSRADDRDITIQVEATGEQLWRDLLYGEPWGPLWDVAAIWDIRPDERARDCRKTMLEVLVEKGLVTEAQAGIVRDLEKLNYGDRCACPPADSAV